MKAPRTLVGRGALAGAAGATALALWFLVFDVLQGEPFRTPTFLAGALGLQIGASALSVVVYTLIHYLVFAAVGVAAAWVAERLDRVPGLPLGIVLGFLLFNIVFYGSVWITGIDVVRELGGWPRVLLGNVLAGITLFGVLTAFGTVDSMHWRDMLAEHYTVREGLVTGLIGAAVVAVWFLVVDLIGGRILFTPAALGSALFHGARDAAAVQINAGTVLGYTLIHLAAFLLTGLIAAAIAAAAEEETEAALLGGVLLFVTLEVFAIGLLAIVAVWLIDALSWWNIGGANLLAALSMGAYLYYRHPNLARDMGKRNLEEDLAHDVPAPGHAKVAGR